MKVEESLNMTFDESPPPTKLSSLVDDDVGEEEAIRKNTKIVNTNNEEDESIEVDEIINIKESKYHPLDQFGLEIPTTRTRVSMEIGLTKDDEADSVDSSKYQENPKTTHLEAVKRIFRTLESRYVHEGRTIDPSFYNDLSDDSVAKFTTIGEEQPNERIPSPPPRKKSISPPQAPSKSIYSKSTHYTSSSSPSESPTPTHVAPLPKLHFVIPIKLEPQELPPPQMSLNDPYAQTIDNWPSDPSNLSPPPHVSRPPPGFPNPPPRFEPFPSTQPLFVNINNNIPLLYNNAPPFENIHNPPLNLGN
ncbi:hypothetical protein Tco_0666612 [Tanacetum coccineum]